MFALVESHDGKSHEVSIRAIGAFLGQSRVIVRRRIMIVKFYGVPKAFVLRLSAHDGMEGK